jgi:hypothetical protein
LNTPPPASRAATGFLGRAEILKLNTDSCGRSQTGSVPRWLSHEKKPQTSTKKKRPEPVAAFFDSACGVQPATRRSI